MHMNKKLIINFINILTGLLDVVVTIIILGILTKVLQSQLNNVSSFLINAVVMIILSKIVVYTLKKLSLRLMVQESGRIKTEYYEKYIFGDLDKILQNDFVEYTARLSKDFEKVVHAKFNLIANMIVIVLTTIGYLGYLFMNNVVLTVVIFLVASASVAIPIGFNNLFKMSYEAYIENWEKCYEHMLSAIKNMAYMKMFRLEDYFNQKNIKYFGALKESSFDIDRLAAYEKGAKNGIVVGLKVLWLIVISCFFTNGWITLGQIAIFVYIGVKLIDEIPNLYHQYYEFIDSKVSENRLKIFEELGYKAISVVKIPQNQVFEEVVLEPFTHSMDKLIHYPEIKIKDKSKILIQGKNGSGKTTFFRLLTGLISSEFSEKALENFEFNVDDTKASSTLKKLYSYMPQEFYYVKDTAKEELLRKPNDTIKEQLMNQFAMKEFLSNEECLWNLSGGEQQKINFIRTMMEDAEILLLDEPTNNLDVKSVEIMKDILKKVEKTMIVISHDDRIKDIFDEIIVFEVV